jgi:nucleoside-diphosphate-sugar epimerase
MNTTIVLVTGAAGFVGRYVVMKLCEKDFKVRAGVRNYVDGDNYSNHQGIEIVVIDILDRNSLIRAMRGAEIVFHFAALVDSHSTREDLYRINVEGTKNVWKCAVECGVKKALYCSSTAVYGLLAKSKQAITENIQARAVEPYGATKFLGELAALEIGKRSNLHTTIIRPVAIFGPGEHTPFGKKLRDAAVSKLLVAGGFQNKKFNYVHVEDVAEAAIYLTQKEIPSGQIYNITVNEPILFEEAFQAYIRVLQRAGSPYTIIRLLALISTLLHKLPYVLYWISKILGEHFVFNIWHAGFDLNYSSVKLLDTSFKFKWINFDEVFYSCLEKE